MWKKFFKKNSSEFIAISAAPKSASQLFIKAFDEIFQKEFKVIRGKVSSGFGHNFLSQDVIEQQAQGNSNYAVYGHYPMFQHNNNVFNQINPKNSCKKAIVIIRSLPDSLISYYDHIEKRGYGPLDFRYGDCAESNEKWSQLSKSEQIDFLIGFIGPWYIRFVNSWMIAKSNGWKVSFVKYEQSIYQLESTIKNVNEQLELALVNDYRLSIDQKVNFNQGVSGRGIKELSSKQITQLELMLKMLINDSSMSEYLISGEVI